MATVTVLLKTPEGGTVTSPNQPKWSWPLCSTQRVELPLPFFPKQLDTILLFHLGAAMIYRQSQANPITTDPSYSVKMRNNSKLRGTQLHKRGMDHKKLHTPSGNLSKSGMRVRFFFSEPLEASQCFNCKMYRTIRSISKFPIVRLKHTRASFSSRLC
jgi:hypothetical protein